MENKGIPISRRGFLALSGAGIAGAATAGCSANSVSSLVQLIEEDRRVPRGEEKWVVSSCGQCSGGCSIRVRTIGGRAVNITGNPLYPLNRKGICPKGIAGLQVLYDPDRIRQPLKRIGNRGEGKWQKVSWNEAVGTVAERLRDIRQRGEPEKLVFLSGESRGLMDAFVSRFCRAFGTPNDIRKISPALEAESLVRYCTQGTLAPFAYDLENCNYLLSFGYPLLEANVSPVRTLRAHGVLRQERPGPKARIVQIEPRLSVTAGKADEWVPVNPGTEGALALGIAYVLIRERLYDESFVKSHTFGFEDWTDGEGNSHAGFKRTILEEYHVDEVARITGIPVSTILRIGKEFGSARPAIAMGEMTSTNAVYNLMAVHALNALVGSIDVSGGIVFPRGVPFKELPKIDLDETAARGLKHERLDHASTREFPLSRHVASALPQAIIDKPESVQALFLYQVNPLYSSPSSKLAEAFTKIPLIVSFSPFLDESSAYADLILPDHTYLERWQDDPAPPVVPFVSLALRQPVVDPLYDTMNTGDVLIKIAREVGGPLASAFPWEDFVKALGYSISGLFEARRGGIVEGSNTAGSWVGHLEERGWWYPSYGSFDEFWAQLQEKGGWWDPEYEFGEWDRIFATSSGKFEFYSTNLRKALGTLANGDDKRMESLLADLKLSARGDRVALPHFEPPRFVGAEEKYPLQLNVVRLMPLTKARNASQPFLQEILGPHLHVQWDSWLEINPETAARLGIADGDLVWLESPAGRIKVRARFYAGAMPQVVNIPAGLGHTDYGRWAKGIGVNPMVVTANEYDRLGGLSAVGATRVRVTKA